jgi:hypothetical protein
MSTTAAGTAAGIKAGTAVVATGIATAAVLNGIRVKCSS